MIVAAAQQLTVRLSTDLAAPPEAVWELLRRPSTLRHVAWPLLRFPDLDHLEDREWQQGQTVRTRLLFLGVVPISRHRLTLERLDPEAGVLQSDEGGGVITSWRHLITMEPRPAGRTRYTDVVEVRAGVLTIPVALFAAGFYRWRQHRWRRLVRRQHARGFRRSDGGCHPHLRRRHV